MVCPLLSRGKKKKKSPFTVSLLAVPWDREGCTVKTKVKVTHTLQDMLLLFRAQINFLFFVKT